MDSCSELAFLAFPVWHNFLEGANVTSTSAPASNSLLCQEKVSFWITRTPSCSETKCRKVTVCLMTHYFLQWASANFKIFHFFSFISSLVCPTKSPKHQDVSPAGVYSLTYKPMITDSKKDSTVRHRPTTTTTTTRCFIKQKKHGNSYIKPTKTHFNSYRGPKTSQHIIKLINPKHPLFGPLAHLKRFSTDQDRGSFPAAPENPRLLSEDGWHVFHLLEVLHHRLLHFPRRTQRFTAVKAVWNNVRRRKNSQRITKMGLLRKPKGKY